MASRVGKRDPCPCGSGRRYERCHLPQDVGVYETDRGVMLHLSAEGARRRYPEMVEEMRAKSALRGIAPPLVALLAAKSKADQARLADGLNLTQVQLFDLTMLSEQVLGLQHSIHHAEHTPQHLRPGRSGVWIQRSPKAIPDGPSTASPVKLVQLFKERKQLLAHLFQRGEDWHAFVCEFREAFRLEEAKWVGGTHMHFVSHLWPRVTLQQVIDYVSRGTQRPPTVHIRFGAMAYPG
jgi:hypothetical protein